MSFGGRLRYFGVRAALVALGIVLGAEAVRFPDFDALRDGEPGKTSFMAYREREAAVRQETYRIDQRWVGLESISLNLRNAVLAAEDDRFFEHEGFDYDEIRDAIEDHVRDGRPLRGASTISQQLIKNLYLSPERSLWRKGREAVYTHVLERRLGKERILELYLNVAEWGRGRFGAEAAAQHYFGVHASRLTARQSALLAAALPSPLERNPARPSRHHRRQADRIRARMARRSPTVDRSPTAEPRKPRPRSTAPPPKSPPADALLETPRSKPVPRDQLRTPTPTPAPPRDLLKPES